MNHHLSVAKCTEVTVHILAFNVPQTGCHTVMDTYPQSPSVLV